MHIPESVLENEIHKLFWDFDKPMDHLTLARRPDQVIKKRNCWIADFACPTVHIVKFEEIEKKDTYLNITRKLKMLEHLSDIDTNCNWCPWYSH